MNESDLLIVIGASFSNHTGIAPYKKIVQIDDDHAAIGRFHGVDVGVLGDAAATLTLIVDQLASAFDTGDARPIDQRADIASALGAVASRERASRGRQIHRRCGIGSDLRRARAGTALQTP